MQRILEPEIMGDAEQSLAYANADFSASNQDFVERLVKAGRRELHKVVDLGCGPCDVMIRLAATSPHATIMAIDGSAAMISLADKAVRAAGFETRVHPMQGYIPGVALPDNEFDAVLSKDFLHHLPDPMALWLEALRLGSRKAIIQVMDLVRPETPEAARNIVESVAPNEPAILKEDFYNSLCAAFTLQEVKAQLEAANLSMKVLQISERHMLIHGTLP